MGDLHELNIYEHIVNRMSDVGVANLATHWHEVPLASWQPEWAD